MSVRNSYRSAVGALAVVLGALLNPPAAWAAPISVGLVGRSDGEQRVLAILVVEGLSEGDSVRVSWGLGNGGAAEAETSFVSNTGRLRALRRAFSFGGGDGDVCVTCAVSRGGVCEEQEACLHVAADSLNRVGWLRTGHVVRSEVVEHGVRYRIDGGIRVPIPRAERILGSQIRVLGERAAVAVGDSEGRSGGEGQRVEAIVCVDSTGAVTRVTPLENLSPELLESLKATITRMRFRPGRLQGKAVADWVRVSMRLMP